MEIPIENLPAHLMENRKRINRRDALHYCPPCGGGWGVVKTAVQVPEIVILFIIPLGCGRHGSIAARKDGTASRIHYLLVEEVDLVSGDHLAKTEEAVRSLVKGQDVKGLILFTTCMDDLLGSDYEELMERLEEDLKIPLVRGRMNPILSDTPKAPEIMVHNTVYGFLRERQEIRRTHVNLIGSLSPVSRESELFDYLKSGGIEGIHHVGQKQTFEEFLKMGQSRVNLLINPMGKRACTDMEKRLNLPFLEVLSSFLPEKIDAIYKKMEDLGNFSLDLEPRRQALLEAMENLRPHIKGKSAALGKTVNADSFDLALFLHRLGLDLRYILAATVKEHEHDSLKILMKEKPDLKIIPHLDPRLAVNQDDREEVDFGIGLDTAVYFKPRKLVLIPFEETLYGYHGALTLVEKLRHAQPFEGSVKDLVYSANLVI